MTYIFKAKSYFGAMNNKITKNQRKKKNMTQFSTICIRFNGVPDH